MNKVSKKLLACVLVAIVLTSVHGGNVVVQEGVIEGERFKGTSCTASGDYSTALGVLTTASGDAGTAIGWESEATANCATAMGHKTTASGLKSTAMGYETTASASYSTAMGFHTTASGLRSLAIGSYTTAGTGSYTTAIGKSFANDVQDSFAVGFGQKNFSVESGLVTIYDDLYVTYDVDANTYSEHSSFYDKDTYGRALDYAEDSSQTITVNAEGVKEYDHEGDPEFLKKWVTVKDYDQYTEEEVWNEDTQESETVRIYETHQELRSSLSMKVAWLRQCVFELKQENETLKVELAQIKQVVGLE